MWARVECLYSRVGIGCEDLMSSIYFRLDRKFENFMPGIYKI